MHLILKILSTLLLLIFYIYAYPQAKTKISGQIIDSKTNQPIPYAHVSISNTAIGTVTNTEGYFALNIPPQLQGHFLTITSIGYEKRVLKIEDIKETHLIIKLKEDVRQLKEVIIATEEDIALELVKAAVKRIPQNYPNEPEMLRSFYREVSRYKGKIEYVIESVIDTYKESYGKPTNKGSVRVVKARKYEDQKREKLRISFYGTGHAGNSFDFVMRKQGPLNLKKIDAYHFRIIDTVQHNQQSVAKVSFYAEKDKSGKGRGVLYITLKTKAFVRGEYSYNAQEVAVMEKVGSVINGYKRLNRKYSTEYKAFNSVWHIDLITYSTEFLTPSGDTLKLDELFSVSNIKQNPSNIPYNEQLQFGDVFLEHTGEYDPDFWAHYDIVVPEREIESLFKNAKQETAPKALALRDVLRKFKGGFSLFASNAEILPINVEYANNGFTINKAITQEFYYYFGYSTSLEYELTSKLFIGLENRESFGRHRHQTFALKLGWENKFNIAGRPAYLVPTLNIGYYRYGYSLGSFQNTNEISVKGKKFNSESIEVALESRRFAVEPMLRLSFERSHRLRFFVEAGWAFALKSWDGIFLKEEDGFLFWKKRAFLNATESHLIFTEEQDRIKNAGIKPFVTANIGVMLHL